MAKRWVPINLTGGINADSNLDNVEVADARNLVSDPDGQGMKFREGTALYQKAVQQTTPAGGIAIQVNSRVPNLDNGNWIVVCSNTSYNNRIEHIAMTSPRNGISGESIDSTLRFEVAQYTTLFGQTVTLTVIREGNLTRPASVTYATANGTATAGVDYTAATGSLIFDVGDFSKTISITTLDAGQGLDKTFTVTLAINSTGITIGEPRTATVTGQVLSMIMGHNVWSSATQVMATYLYNPVNARVTGHYFRTPFTVTTARYGCGEPLVRVNRNTIAMVLGDAADSDNLKFGLYSVDQIAADGAAYSAGALNITNAIKHEVFSHGQLVGVSGTNDAENFWIVPYSQEEFFVVSLSGFWRFNTATSAMQFFPVQTGSASFTTWTNICGESGVSGGPGCRPQFGPNGKLYVYVDTMNATNVRKVLMFDPVTLNLEAISSAVSAQASAMVVLSTGEVIVKVGTGATKFSADLSTATTLTGGMSLAAQTGFYSGGTSWYGYAETPTSQFKKYSVSGTTVAEDVIYPSGPPFDVTSPNVPSFQFGLVTASTFAAGFHDGTGTLTCGVYNVADGTVATGFAQVAQQDFYGAESIVGSLFTSLGFVSFARNDQPDITLYHLKNFAGTMT